MVINHCFINVNVYKNYVYISCLFILIINFMVVITLVVNKVILMEVIMVQINHCSFSFILMIHYCLLDQQH